MARRLPSAECLARRIMDNPIYSATVMEEKVNLDRIATELFHDRNFFRFMEMKYSNPHYGLIRHALGIARRELQYLSEGESRTL